MSETLKPCPFCGCADLKEFNGLGGFVSCKVCFANGPCMDIDSAKWNAAPRPGDAEAQPGLWAIYIAAARYIATGNEVPLRAAISDYEQKQLTDALAHFEGSPALTVADCADCVTARFIESADAQEVAP